MTMIYGNISTICEPTVNEWKVYSLISWWVQGFAALIISSIGMVLNSLAVAILINSKNTESAPFNRLLVCLAVFDNLFLSNGISEALRGYLVESGYYDYVFITFLYPFRSMVMFCSMYTTVVLAYVRYDAITRPLQYTIRARQQISSPSGSTIKYVTPITVVAVLFYTPKFFEFKVTNRNENCLNSTVMVTSTLANNCSHEDYDINETGLRRDKNYVLWYMNILNIVFTVVVPFTLLVYFYTKIYIGMKHFEKRQPSLRKKINQSTNKDMGSISNDSQEKSVIIFSLVLMFLSCHILRVVLNIQELIYFEWSSKDIERGCYGVRFWAMVLVPISEFMLLTNSSANFFIYFCFYEDFRRLVHEKYYQIVLSFPKRSRTIHTNRTIGNKILQEETINSHQSHVVRDNTFKNENIELVEIHQNTT